MSYREFHECPEDGRDTSVLDTDGSVLYECPYGGLLSEIVKRNDVATLQQYIQKNRGMALAYYGGYSDDVFLVAAMRGNLDALRLLLEEYRINATAETQLLDDRGFVLLNEACRYGQVETVLFLLDSEPPLGTLHAQHPGGETALLAAADFFVTLSSDRVYHEHDADDWIGDCLAHGEKLMYLLLDRGASVHDSITVRCTDNRDLPPQPLYTVLSRAVSRGSYNLVKRLIDEGADVHAREEHFDNGFGGAAFRRSPTTPRDVTALHYASIYWNAEGIKALLDHRGSDVDIAEMVSARDSIGRLPLHWAAAGADGVDELLIPEKDVVPRVVNTFKLLLAGNPNIINVQDNEQMTALHYAVASHASSGTRHSHDEIKFLCENGADAGLQDCKGQTVLHMLAYWSVHGEPINTALIDLLVAHGANINHADRDGTTALHIMARNLRQVKAAQFLISRGADVHARDLKGNTPLHEVVARGVLPALQTRHGYSGPVTLDDRIGVQDEIIGLLLKAGGSTLMDQPNAAGKTPRQLLEETRANWHRIEEDRNRPFAGRGRGRPLNQR